MLRKADFHMANNVVFFADKKQAARAGQLRDKIPNPIWFYDIFTPDVIGETGMLQANGMYNRDMSQLAASMFARVTKGTAYLVIGKEDAPDSPLKPRPPDKRLLALLPGRSAHRADIKV
jgi:hypothetical protein